MSRRTVWLLSLLALALVLAGAVFVWRDDILRTALDPRTPFQTYTPPRAPDYGRREAWALLPARPETWTSADPPADIFFVHPTTYDGGREWNAPLDERGAVRRLAREVLPNHAGPYQRVGRVFAPRYRQASLYSFLTLRDDAREARAFAYGDVREAFRLYQSRYNRGRPFLLVGAEQGASLAARLLAEEVATDPAFARRMIGAHLTHMVLPADSVGAPLCAQREQARCVLAFAVVRQGEAARAQRLLQRALVWAPGGQLANLGPRPAACVNPLLGARTDALAPVRANLGAANATGLEWGLRPGFLARQVSAQCRAGVLRVSRPEAASLRPRGGWADRLRAPAYNLFYRDLEADAEARLAALLRLDDWDRPAPPITRSVAVQPAPVRRID